MPNDNQPDNTHYIIVERGDINRVAGQIGELTARAMNQEFREQGTDQQVVPAHEAARLFFIFHYICTTAEADRFARRAVADWIESGASPDTFVPELKDQMDLVAIDEENDVIWGRQPELTAEQATRIAQVIGEEPDVRAERQLTALRDIFHEDGNRAIRHALSELDPNSAAGVEYLIILAGQKS